MDMFRDSAAFHLSLITLELSKKDLMPAIGYGFEKAIIMGGVTEREV
jgi:Co/Zn/Cd efflux system component